MNLIKESTIKLFTTPEELRIIADKMEAKWSNIKWGQSSVAVKILVRDKHSEIWWVEFAVNQDTINERDKYLNLEP